MIIHVTTAAQARERTGYSRGNERGFDQSFATASVGEIRGLLYICREGRADCGGKTALVLPTSSPRRVGLLAGICWIKSQVPAKSPPGLGGRGYKPTT